MFVIFKHIFSHCGVAFVPLWLICDRIPDLSDLGHLPMCILEQDTHW